MADYRTSSGEPYTRRYAEKRKEQAKRYRDSAAGRDARRTADLRRRAAKAGASVEVVRPADVFERDGWRCGICAAPVDPVLAHPDPMSASVDHLVPLSLGGAHSMANVQCAHLQCNIRKNTRPGGEQLRLIG